MFGFKRRKVTTQVLDGVRPIFRAIEMAIGHLPEGLRSDPYVLGYFMATVFSLTAIASNNSVKGADAGMVMLDVG